MRIIVHLGRPKTGSTAIQSWLRANRVNLASQGYALSDVCGAPNNIHLAAYFGAAPRTWHHQHSFVDAAAAREHLDRQHFPKKLADEMDRCAEWASTMVLSSEQLARIRDPVDLRSFLTRFVEDVHVVGYVRVQTEAITSGWYTSVKAGAVASLNAFTRTSLQRGRLDYEQWALRWVAALGEENCRFYEYRESPEWDIRRHFAERILGIEEPLSLVFGATRENRKWTKSETEVVRAINRVVPLLPSRTSHQSKFNLSLRRLALRTLRGQGSVIRLSDHQSETVLAHFRESNQRFAARFLDSEGFGE